MPFHAFELPWLPQFARSICSCTMLCEASGIDASPLNTQPFEYEPFSWPLASIVTVNVTSSPSIVCVRCVYTPASVASETLRS